MLKRSFAIGVFAAALLGAMAPLAASHGHSHEDDHEQARRALEAGQVLPLRAVMDQVERDIPGQIVKIEFDEDDGIWIYKIKVLRRDGKLIKLKIDARNGAILKTKGPIASEGEH
ncbi:MAG TPA: PepSY domain-containing protein [Candidimonas sp.]|nr:PepSY domain-containing protein [Candidimonas sp.]